MDAISSKNQCMESHVRYVMVVCNDVVVVVQDSLGYLVAVLVGLNEKLCKVSSFVCTCEHVCAVVFEHNMCVFIRAFEHA